MNLQQALAMHAKGTIIFPITRDKRPDTKLVPHFSDLLTAPPSEETVRSWFQNGDRNIAITTGKENGITVIDIDVNLVGQPNAGQPVVDYKLFPETFTVKTGSGGYHLYYKYRAVGGKIDSEIHFDIKNDGGYVVAPGSETDDSYDEKRAVRKKGGKYEILHNRPLAEFPEGGTITKFVSERKKFDHGKLEKPAVSGERNSRLTSIIGLWLAQTPKALWHTVLEMALAWNQKNCSPALKEFEVRQIFQSICSRESKKVRREKIEYHDEISPAEVIHLAEAAEIHAQTVSGEKLPTGIELLDNALEGGLQIENLAVVSGYTSEGKSLFAMYITANMLKSGTPVLWFQFELPPTEFWRKYQELGVTKEMPVFVPKVYRTATMDWVEELIITAKDLGVKVVVFDLLDFLQSGERRKQDKNLEDLEIVTKLKLIATKHKVAIILMAHARKPEGREQAPTIYDVRGTGSITGISNWVLLVYRIKVNKKRNELVTSENTFYSSFSLQKNRINGKELTFYGSYLEGRLTIETDLDRIRFAQGEKISMLDNL